MLIENKIADFLFIAFALILLSSQYGKRSKGKDNEEAINMKNLHNMFVFGFTNEGTRGLLGAFYVPSVGYQLYKMLNDRRSEQFLHKRIM